MCKGLYQMRSSGMVSLDEFVPSSSPVRKLALCVFESSMKRKRVECGGGGS